MDLTRAIELANAGKPQAPEDLGEIPAFEHASRPQPSRRARGGGRAPVKVPEQPLDLGLALTPAEWYSHVNRVAEGLVERLENRSWYDLHEVEREEYRTLAVAALLAVSAAEVHRSMNRIRERLEPRAAGPEITPSDLAERERLAEIDAASLKLWREGLAEHEDAA